VKINLSIFYLHYPFLQQVIGHIPSFNGGVQSWEKIVRKRNQTLLLHTLIYV